MASSIYNYIATSAFGLEATVKREVMRLGQENLRVSDGRIDFSGPLSLIPKANIRLRASDRVLLVIGEFGAHTFDELFEGTKGLPWDEFITEQREVHGHWQIGAFKAVQCAGLSGNCEKSRG